MAYILAFITGALVTPLLPKTLLLPLGLQVALVLGGLATAGAARLRFARPAILVAALLVASLFAGGVLSQLGVQQLVGASLDERWHGRDLLLSGSVETVVDQSDKISRFHFHVNSASVKGDESIAVELLRNRLVRLSWYYGPALRQGDEWSLSVRLKRPRGFINPRGFDYSAWLLSQELVATGYVRQGERIAQLAHRSPQQGATSHLATMIADADIESAPFFRALLLGDTSSIDHHQWRVLQRTGTIHLMAISGLHVGLVATLGFWLGRLLAGLLTLSRHLEMGRGLATYGLPGLPAARWLPALVSCTLALCYSSLAGFAIPTQRAFIIVLLANLAILWGVRASPLRLLALACVLVLWANPLAPTQNGFWLSFLAVVVLVLGFAGRTEHPGFVGSLVRAQILLTVGLLGPLLMLGQPISVVGPPANLLAVPVVSVLVVPGLLLAGLVSSCLPDAASLLLQGLDLAFGLLWQVLAALSEMRQAVWWPHFAMSAGAFVLLVMGAGLLLAPRGLGLRGLGMLLAVFALGAPRPAPPPFTLTVLEVGQGLAVWVRAGNSHLLYDTGPRFSADFDAGSRIVVPFLQSQGVHALDLLAVSHSDGDHSGGLHGVVNNMPVRQLVVGEQSTTSLPLQAELCKQGQSWRFGEVQLSALWPPVGYSGAGNNSSCVLLLQWRGERVLLTGDIDAGVEEHLLQQELVPKDLSLVIAPHHGSSSSSSRAFVEHLRADAVVFSAGFQNRYGHPHPDVTARFESAGTRYYNTAELGALTFTWRPLQAEPAVESARQALNRAWH